MVKKSKGVDTKFWSVFLVLFIASTLAITFSSLDSITGNVAIQNIAFANAGTIDYEVNEGGIKSVKLHLSETIKGGKVTFESGPAGTDYSNVLISSNVEDKISQLDLTLKLKESKLISMGINNPIIKINGKQMPISFSKRQDAYVFYSVSIKEFGQVIITQKPAAKAQQPTPKEVVALPKEVVAPPPKKAQPAKIPPVITAPKEGFFSKVGKFFSNFLGK